MLPSPMLVDWLSTTLTRKPPLAPILYETFQQRSMRFDTLFRVTMVVPKCSSTNLECLCTRSNAIFQQTLLNIRGRNILVNYCHINDDSQNILGDCCFTGMSRTNFLINVQRLLEEMNRLAPSLPFPLHSVFSHFSRALTLQIRVGISSFVLG